ncbi:putative FMN-binding regulatory protein PaiB [Bradyrhizobium sp. AZCC 2262]
MIPHLAALMRATRSLSAIRVIDLVVDEIEEQAKLNQHKSDEDHVAVADRLAQAKEEDAGAAAGVGVWRGGRVSQRVARNARPMINSA